MSPEAGLLPDGRHFAPLQATRFVQHRMGSNLNSWQFVASFLRPATFRFWTGIRSAPAVTNLALHCSPVRLSVAEKHENAELMASLQTAGMVKRCCWILNAHFAPPRAGVLADVVQMTSDILLHLGRTIPAHWRTSSSDCNCKALFDCSLVAHLRSPMSSTK